MLIGERDKGIPDRNDCQNQTRSEVTKIASILVGGLWGRQ